MDNSRLKTIIDIASAPLLVLVAHLIMDMGLHLYSIIKWLDFPMHFMGGLAIAISADRFIDAVQKERRSGPMDWQLRVIFIISLVALAAVFFWEFTEFIGDTFVYHAAYYQVNVGDTMKDLAMGLFGGIVTSLILRKRVSGQQPTPPPTAPQD